MNINLKNKERKNRKINENINIKRNSTRFIFILIIFFTSWLGFTILISVKKFSDDAIESTDSYFYLKIAEKSAVGEKFTHPVYSPGYSWFVSILYKTGLDVELAGRITSSIFGFGTLVLTYLFSKEIFLLNLPRYESHILGFLSSSLLSFAPKFVWASSSTLPYTTSTFFFILSCFLSFITRKKIQENKISFLAISFLSGAAGGIGYVVRPEIILSLFISAIFTRNFYAILLSLLGFFVSSLPYHILSFNEGNLPSIISKLLLYKGEKIKTTSEGVKIKIENSGKIFSPKGYLKTFVSNIHLFHKYALPGLLTSSYIFVFGMGFLHIVKHWEKLKDIGKTIFIILTVWFLFNFIIAIVADYFFIPILPQICMISSLIFIELYKNKKAIWLILFFVFSLNIFYSLRPFYKDEGRKLYKIAGKWIAEKETESKIIFEPFPFATFYSGKEWTTTPEKADIWVISSLDHTSARGKPELIILPQDKIRDLGFAEPITEIKYKNNILRVFKPKLNN
jgi:hypothetical protein